LGWNSPAFRRLYQRSDALIALTHGEADWLVEHGADRAKVHVIGIGPMNDPSAPVQPALNRLGDDRKIVLFLGQLHRYKGFAEVLEAAKLLEHRRDVQFVFAGPDVRGHSGVFAHARPGVTWLGTVSDDLRDSLLCACTAVCVPSSGESFGGVAVEAWSCGKPVIGGPAAATRELIADGVDGFVVPQDPQVIADRLTRLLDDPGLAQAMGSKGKEKVRQKYNWDSIADAHIEVYRSLTA
jgi:glycosyltransferase involved in cell wall biosynthesis